MESFRDTSSKSISFDGSVDLQQSTCRRVARHIVLSKAFQFVIVVLVLANAVQMGVEADHPDLKDAWFICENLFTSFFLLEMLLKVYAFRKEYFMDRGNWLDFALVIFAVSDTWLMTILLFKMDFDLQTLSVLRVLRMLRLLRIIRCIRQSRELLLIIHGIAQAMRTCCWVAIMLGLVMYIISIFFVQVLGRDSGVYPGFTSDEKKIDTFEFMKEFNPHTRFGTMFRSMLTMFNIVILAEWSEVVRPIAVKQPWLLIFFMAFVLVATFGVMNVIVGIVVDHVMTQARELERASLAAENKSKLAILRKIKEVVFSIDTDGDGEVSMEELCKGMQHDVMQILLRRVGLPRDFAGEELMCMLDTHGTGSLDGDTFVKNFYRLVEASPFQQACMVQSSINELKLMVKHVDEQLNTRMDNLDSRMHAQCEKAEIPKMMQERCGLADRMISGSTDDSIPDGPLEPFVKTQGCDWWPAAAQKELGHFSGQPGQRKQSNPLSTSLPKGEAQNMQPYVSGTLCPNREHTCSDGENDECTAAWLKLEEDAQRVVLQLGSVIRCHSLLAAMNPQACSKQVNGKHLPTSELDKIAEAKRQSKEALTGFGTAVQVLLERSLRTALSETVPLQRKALTLPKAPAVSHEPASSGPLQPPASMPVTLSADKARPADTRTWACTL